MDLPTPPNPLATLAVFLRERLAERVVAVTARQVATVIVGAAAPFAPTSYSRARLLRQLHASGLLSADEAVQVGAVLELEAGARS